MTVGGASDGAARSIVEAPDGTVAVTLAADLASVPWARRFVQERWSQLDADMLDDVALIVTELVANAVKHGRPGISLKLRLQPFAVDVAVLDHGPGLPPDGSMPEPADHRSTHGRGLAIVARLASSWGVDPLSNQIGKSVWACIRTTDGSPGGS